MSEGVEELPDDVEALKAMIIAERLRSARLQHLLDVLNRMHFGKRSEKIDSGQLALALEDRDVSMAEAELLVEQGEEATRSEEHTSELQSLMRNSYAVFCLKKKTTTTNHNSHRHPT